MIYLSIVVGLFSALNASIELEKKASKSSKANMSAILGWSTSFILCLVLIISKIEF